MKNAFVNAFVATVALMGLMLIAPLSQADPPPTTCKIKIWHCDNSYDRLYRNETNIHVFDGDDTAKVWATYENALVKEGEYINAHCNHKNCDITGYHVGYRAWEHNFCGANLYLQLTAAYSPQFTTSKPSNCGDGKKDNQGVREWREKLP